MLKYAILVRWLRDANVMIIREYQPDGEMVISQQFPIASVESVFPVAYWHGGSLQVEVVKDWSRAQSKQYAAGILIELGKVAQLEVQSVQLAMGQLSAEHGVTSNEIHNFDWDEGDMYPGLAS